MPNRPLIAGNWKMNGLKAALAELEVMAEAAGGMPHLDMLVCPPVTVLGAAVEMADGRLAVGGQNCHFAESGAHTGEVSAEMLADLGATHVIVGHSERRADCHESDADIAARASAAWRAALVAVVCIGETQGERDAGETLKVLGRQLAGSLPDGASGANTVVAYEPVWAIGTGRTPTAVDVAEAHAFMRKTLVERFGEGEGTAIRLLYGGSVKPGNAAELLGVENVDGALVGGASLKADDFVAICRAAPRATTI